MKLKIIAITDPSSSWKAMVEIDHTIFDALTLTSSCGRCPQVGDEFDIGETFRRLNSLERRERKLRFVAEALIELTTLQEPNEQTDHTNL